MAKFITLKSIAFRWRHFKVNICCDQVLLACNTARTHQQPGLLHSGTSPEKLERDSKRNSIKCPRSPTNIGTDRQKLSPWKRLTRHTSLIWRSTETLASTCKDPMVQQSKGLGPAKLEASLVQRWIRIHAAEKIWPYTCLQTPEWEVRKKLRPSAMRSTISAEEVWWCGMPYPTPEQINWCTSPATLTALDTKMRFWHHTCCPQWTSVGKFSARQRLAAHRSSYCWLSIQPERKSDPRSCKSPDLNPIEHLWDDLDRRVRSLQPAPQALQELQQALEQEWGRIPLDRIRRLIESMPRRVRAVLQANGGTTDIDFEVTSSERYGL